MCTIGELHERTKDLEKLLILIIEVVDPTEKLNKIEEANKLVEKIKSKDHAKRIPDRTEHSTQ